MSEISKVLEAYYAIDPKRFRFLDRIELQREADYSYQLTIDLVRELGNSNGESLKLTFVGVRDLKFGSLEGAFGILLEPRPMRQDQWEDINYRVVDEENDTVRFVCRDFLIAVTNKT